MISFQRLHSIYDHENRLDELTSRWRQALTTRVGSLSWQPQHFRAELEGMDLRFAVHTRMNLSELCRLRSELIVHDLTRYKVPFDLTLHSRRVDGFWTMGVVCRRLSMDPELRGALSYLPRPERGVKCRFFVLDPHVDNNIREYLNQLGVQITRLTESVATNVRLIRSFELDYILYANDVSAKYSMLARLAFYKLARLATLNIATIMPVNSPFINGVFIGASLIQAPGMDISEFGEKLIVKPGVGYCFETYSERAMPARPANPHPTIVSGSNIHKINHETIELWARILTLVPAAKLLLSPFPPHYSADKLRASNSLMSCFEELGIESSRVEIISTSDSPEEWIAKMQEAWVYLDSIPYASLTSIHDALLAGLPVITHQGPFLRNQHASAILRSINRAEWVAGNSEEYVALACEFLENPYNPSRDTLISEFDSVCNVEAFSNHFHDAMQGRLNGDV